MQAIVVEIYIFMLSVFVGFQLISKVPSVLHTPLMSATNAIHGIILVGALTLASSVHGVLAISISLVAIFMATLNVVGGFVVTDRILGMFHTNQPKG